MKNLQLQIVNSILTLSWIGVLLSIAILSLSLTNHFQLSKSEQEDQQGCGTIAPALPIHYSEAEEETYLLGKNLFKLNCAVCHNRNMVDDMTGPALAGIKEGWAEYPREDLYQWIRNSQQLIANYLYTLALDPLSGIVTDTST